MIRALAALTRQVQECFHLHLVGVVSWDKVKYKPPRKVVRDPPSAWPRNRRGGLIRPEFTDGKYHMTLHLEFGVWDLEVDGPSEKPPLGWVKLTGHGTVEGPLDPATWKRIADHIKSANEEFEHVA